jgi:hypothetical protein
MARNTQTAGAVTTVAIVCGYDLDSDLGAYVERVAKRLDGIHVDAIVLSGGRTSPRIDSSEAREMSRHLSALLPHGNVLLDHEAMTTLDNIVYAKRLARQSVEGIERYIVCCDVAHVVKAWLLSHIILRAPIRMLPVHRPVPLYIWLREPLSILLETFGALIPPFRGLLARSAAQMKGVTAKQRRSARPEDASAAAPPHPLTHTSGTAARPDPPAPRPTR